MVKQILGVLVCLIAIGGCASNPNVTGTLPATPMASPAASMATGPGAPGPSALGSSALGSTAAGSMAPGAVSATAGAGIPAEIGVPPTPAMGVGSYRLGAGDLLQIDVFRVPDLATKERINEYGLVVIPLIGPVSVAGLTTEQAGRKIAAELEKDHLQNPQVSVLVLEYANQNITVGGAVNKPGVFPMAGQISLIQAVAMAGGPSDIAKINEVVVFRTLPGQPMTAYVVDLNRVQRGQLDDPLLAVNDKVVVPESGTKVVLRNVTGTMRGLVTLNPLLY
ncbi:hypothetical protein CKO25_06490 [Thiocapsa imhoffii]|uniref:Polysaccharide export protein n=1 Tax=Thiocapsa imhoffii TaxID=382777 RepID=A0A9X0WGV3_9GAMM|nr:polysaccharide biosynthesis/export family protein [Thiocapsa imhoffii]MBK1644308.1 hypothetical protein [Thiocapsa imhoffii]